MHVTTTKEAVQDVAIITATLLIHSTLVVALLDSSSTHTFIAKTFIDKIRLFVEDLRNDFVVSTPLKLCTLPVSVQGVSLWLSSSTFF